MKENSVITTRVALACIGDNLFFDRSVARELAGNHSYAALVAMAVTGNELDPVLAPVLDDIAVVITAADPRLWPMKAIRLMSAYGHTLPAVAAGQLIFQSDMIGPRLTSAAAKLLVDFSEVLGEGPYEDQAIKRALLQRIKQGLHLNGFGLPFRGEDERLSALRNCMERRGRTQKPYWVLFEQLAKVLCQKTKRLPPNVTIGVAAALLDLGFKANEVTPVTLGLMSHMSLAVAWEGAQAPAPQLRQLPLESVRYVGKPARLSPRAQAQQQDG